MTLVNLFLTLVFLSNSRLSQAPTEISLRTSFGLDKSLLWDEWRRREKPRLPPFALLATMEVPSPRVIT